VSLFSLRCEGLCAEVSLFSLRYTGRQVHREATLLYTQGGIYTGRYTYGTHTQGGIYTGRYTRVHKEACTQEGIPGYGRVVYIGRYTRVGRQGSLLLTLLTRVWEAEKPLLTLFPVIPCLGG